MKTSRPQERLDSIVQIIEGVETRCMAVDGPVTATLQEMTERELREIYALAKGTARSDRKISGKCAL